MPTSMPLINPVVEDYVLTHATPADEIMRELVTATREATGDAAIETLRALPAEPAIDFAFIDADKVSYPAYYEEIVTRLRSGGLVVLDNVFLGGRVFDPAFQEEHHLAMRRVNDQIAADDRVEAVMLPVRDGVTVARRR